MSEPFLAVINPAAGGGRCGKLVDAALGALSDAGVQIDAVPTHGPGEATAVARQAYRDGRRNFMAVGGDGTAHEIVNGLFPEALDGQPPTMALLPLGTGNSFLRDFSAEGLAHTRRALIQKRRHPCDVLCMTHASGRIYYTNLLSVGFVADVAEITNRRFKRFGERAYVLGVLWCLIRRRLHRMPLRFDGGPIEQDPCLFLSFNNSKYTGGRMMIAPHADIADGLIEVVRVGPIGRCSVLRYLRKLYDGSYLNLPMASRRAVRRIDFEPGPAVAVMVDGEVVHLACQSLEVLPAALEVVA